MQKDVLEGKVDALYKAMKGVGTKEEVIIEIILSLTKTQRQELKLAFKSSYGKDLEEELKSELSGNFQEVILSLLHSPAEYDAKQLYKSMKGIGTNEDTLIEIICTRSNWMLKEIKEVFFNLYKKDLVATVEHETSGHFKKILGSLLQCERSENPHPDESACKDSAHQLYVAGVGKTGTDEPIFNKIFAKSSPAELFSIIQWYSKITGGKSLYAAVEKEFSGDIKRALLTILDALVDQTAFFAKRVNKSIKGLGTNNNLLIRTLVSREEIDIREMKDKYKEIFKKDMIQDIIDDTSGHYQKALVGICQK